MEVTTGLYCPVELVGARSGASRGPPIWRSNHRSNGSPTARSVTWQMMWGTVLL